MGSFTDLERHFGALPPSVVNALTRVAEARGRQVAFRRQYPHWLETLREIAVIQSAEASNAIENIHAPIKRIAALVADRTIPRNRSEQEIAGYRFALDQIHANRESIPFEPRYVLQFHGYLARFTGDTRAGRWKGTDNKVQEHRPGGRVVDRFQPVSASETPRAMDELHAGWTDAVFRGRFDPLLLAAAYILDFLVIHPFHDGNGRMSRLLTLLLLYISGHDVVRYVSIEKLIEETKETYYEALARSTLGWHENIHDLGPWTDYFLGIVIAAYGQMESRAAAVSGRGAKKALVKSFIRSSLSADFSVEDIRNAAPGVSDAHIKATLMELKKVGAVTSLGKGRSARWRRLRTDAY